MSFRLRDFMPRGLYARATAIIILPVVIMQIAITYVFLDDLWNVVSRRMGTALAGEIAVSIALYHRDPSPENLKYISGLVQREEQLTMTFLPGDVLPDEKTRTRFSLLDPILKRAMQERFGEEFWFDARNYPRVVEIRVPVQGGVMQYVTSGKRAYVTSGHVFLLWVLALTAMLTTVSVLFIRNQVRPILRLANLAEAFGRGEDIPEDFRPSGATEVRRAAYSVLKMRERIKRHVEQRTRLLASVSHDLRTPLTRLKLQTALLPESEDRAAMRRDIADMEHMLDEYLDFARGQWVEEPDPVDVGELLAAAAAPMTDKVKLDVTPGLIANVRGGAMKRAFTNLLQNAAAHAAHIEAQAYKDQDVVVVVVDDDGPGIPAEQRAEALRAFTRLDASRNQNVKGVGLGLAIVRDVARGHGGDLTLDTSPMGGLRAVIRIPASVED
jgi:two-component system osmolarity sensor histidine kinase EnvZ